MLLSFATHYTKHYVFIRKRFDFSVSVLYKALLLNHKWYLGETKGATRPLKGRERHSYEHKTQPNTRCCQSHLSRSRRRRNPSAEISSSSKLSRRRLALKDSTLFPLKKPRKPVMKPFAYKCSWGYFSRLTTATSPHSPSSRPPS